MNRFVVTNAHGIVYITVLDDRVIVEFVANNAAPGEVFTDVVPLTHDAMMEIAEKSADFLTEHERDDRDLAIMAAEVPPDATVH